MQFHINKEMLKEAAKETIEKNKPGYTEIIYNMIDGAVWGIYHTNYNSWTDIETETEIKINVKRKYNAKELEARIRNEIREIQKNLKEPGAKERLPEKWVYLVTNIKL